MAISTNTNKPIIAGIINITAGCIKLLGAVYLFLFVANIIELTWFSDFFDGFSFTIWVSIMLLILFGVLAIAGGVSNIKRKRWAWALTGSIVSIFPCVILGITTTILTTLSKNEFR
jgi:hypothetical protein